jgi:hypothetical protein
MPNVCVVSDNGPLFSTRVGGGGIGEDICTMKQTKTGGEGGREVRDIGTSRAKELT